MISKPSHYTIHTSTQVLSFSFGELAVLVSGGTNGGNRLLCSHTSGLVQIRVDSTYQFVMVSCAGFKWLKIDFVSWDC